MARHCQDPMQIEIELDGSSDLLPSAAPQCAPHRPAPHRSHPRVEPTGREKAPASPPVASEALIADYLSARADLRPLSRSAYERDLRGFAAYLAPHDLLSGGTGDVRAWIQATMRDPDDPADPRRLSVRSMRRALSSITQFYRWARRARLIHVAPDVDLPVEPERHAPPVLSYEAVQALFMNIEVRLRQTRSPKRAALLILDAVVLRLCYNLGLRIAEASGIQLSDISEVEGELRITVQVKGGERTTFPVVGVVRHAWDRWAHLRARIQPAEGHGNYLFLHPWTGYRISRRRTWVRLRKNAIAARLIMPGRDRIYPHQLRHARVRHLREQGMDWRDIQALLGHGSPSGALVYVPEAIDEARRMEVLRRSSGA